MESGDVFIVGQAEWDKYQGELQQQAGRQTLAEDETKRVNNNVILLQQWKPSIEKTFHDLQDDLSAHVKEYTSYKGSVNASVKALEDGLAAHKTAYESYKGSVNASVKALEDAGKVYQPKVLALEAWKPTIDKAVSDIIAAVTKANKDRADADAALLNRVSAIEAAITVLKATDGTLAQKIDAAAADVVKLKAEDVAIDLRLDKLEIPPIVPPVVAEGPTEETPDASV